MRTMSSLVCRKNSERRRLLKAARVLVFLLMWVSVLGLTIFHGKTASGQNEYKIEIIVASGDTLWGLAKIHAPRGTDIRDYVDLMIYENNLESPIVYPGQALQLP